MLSPMRARAYVALALVIGCGSPSAAGPAPAPPASSVAVAPGPTAPTSAPPSPPPPTCRPIPATSRDFFARLDDMRRGAAEIGAIQTHHAQLFRHLDLVEQRGVVRSIAVTRADGPHGPIYALTLAPRPGRGSSGAALAFASAPCPGGEPVLLGDPTPLGGADAVIDYVYDAPNVAGARLDDLRVRVTKAPMESFGGVHEEGIGWSFLVGPRPGGHGVLGAAPLDHELEPEPASKVRRHDRHLFGTGWYPLGAAAVLVRAHHAVPDRDDRCRAGDSRGAVHLPPRLALAARWDGRVFATEPAALGVAYVVGLPEGQPRDSVRDAAHALRSGPTAITSRWYGPGSAAWLWGAFESEDAARAAAKAAGAGGVVLATEPSGGARPTPGAPFVVATKPPPPAPMLDCGGY